MEILQIPSHTLLYQGETETSLLGFLIHLEKKHVKDVTFIACLCIYAGKIILSSMRFSCIKKENWYSMASYLRNMQLFRIWRRWDAQAVNAPPLLLKAHNHVEKKIKKKGESTHRQKFFFVCFKLLLLEHILAWKALNYHTRTTATCTKLILGRGETMYHEKFHKQ